MSPKLQASKGGRVEEDRDERTRVEASGGSCAGSRRRLDVGGSGGADGGELSAGEAAVEAISGGGAAGAGASERGAGIEPGEAEEATATGAAADPGEVQRGAGETLWTDASDGAPGGGRRDRAGRGDVAALDAGGGVVEPRAAKASASAAAGAEGTFWGDGAAGWKFSRLAGRARAASLLDEPGGRRDRSHAMPDGRGGDDLGGGGRAAGLDRALRRAAGAVHGLEEHLCAQAEGRGATPGRGCRDAVWAHVSTPGDPHYRGSFPASEGAGGAQSWDAPGSAGEKDAAARGGHARGSQPVPGGVLPPA